MTARVALALVRRVLVVVLMVLILVRPTWGETKVKAQQADLDILVAIDRTRSMIAEDGPGGRTRIEAATADLRRLARQAAGARFGVVTFGGDVVRTEMPFTDDTTAFDSLLSTLKVEGPFDGVGSRVDRPIDQLTEVLLTDKDTAPQRRRLVILVTDGENTAGGKQESFDEVGELVSGGAVLGYGTTDGGRMLVDEKKPDEGYMTDDQGRDALSKIDEANLTKIADELGVPYLHRTTTDPQRIDALADSWDALQVDGDAVTGAERELTWLFGLLLLPLLVWELWPARRRVREVRELDHA